MNFADNLKILRKSKKITQEWLADYLEVSRSTIAGYETKNHHPDFEMLEKLSKCFHVSINFLLTGSDDSSHYELLKVYSELSLKSKQDLLNYIKLLQLRDKKSKKR